VTVRPAEVVRRGAAYLARHDVDAPDVNAERLMLSVLGEDRAAMYARSEGLSTAEAKRYGRLLCRRCAGTPLQHLTGEAGFRGLTVLTRPGVFVPRPETEIVVDLALRSVAETGHPVAVDVGAGTGVIALALKAERPDAEVWATDVSPEAVALTRENAERLGLAVAVVAGDLLAPLPSALRGNVDVVVANPPYVPPEDAETLPREVRQDPAAAVFGDRALTERLLEQAAGWLRAGGMAVIEIDERRGSALSTSARRLGYDDVRVHPDLASRDRVLTVRRP
jgi:release factor glutamine methyltransferase